MGDSPLLRQPLRSSIIYLREGILLPDSQAKSGHKLTLYYNLAGSKGCKDLLTNR